MRERERKGEGGERDFIIYAILKFICVLYLYSVRTCVRACVRMCKEKERDAYIFGKYLGYTYFHSLSVCIGIASQTFDIHLLCLFTKSLLVINNMADNLTIIIYDENHWYTIGKGEYRSHKILCF